MRLDKEGAIAELLSDLREAAQKVGIEIPKNECLSKTLAIFLAKWEAEIVWTSQLPSWLFRWGSPLEEREEMAKSVKEWEESPEGPYPALFTLWGRAERIRKERWIAKIRGKQ